jgi:hypothetical protein
MRISVNPPGWRSSPCGKLQDQARDFRIIGFLTAYHVVDGRVYQLGFTFGRSVPRERAAGLRFAAGRLRLICPLAVILDEIGNHLGRVCLRLGSMESESDILNLQDRRRIGAGLAAGVGILSEIDPICRNDLL